ncbi:MAG: hypothetical protein WC810_02985 [Janthinobacterium sp.]|jgi:hypothetical protein
MKKVFLVLLILSIFSVNAYAVDINDWMRGDGSDVIKGTTVPSDLDTVTQNYLQDPLDRLLTETKNGCALSYTSANVVTIAVGEVACYNSTKTIKRFRRNTATTTVDLSAAGVGGLDTGSEAASTWYYIYAVADAEATTFTVIASASATAPTGITYFRLIGAILNDGSSDILRFNQRGKRVYWDAAIRELTAGASAGYADINCASSIPTNARLGIFIVEQPSSAQSIYVRCNGNSGDSIIINRGECIVVFECPTDASQIIEYKVTANTVDRIDCLGFEYDD